MKNNIFKKVLATVASFAMVATMLPGLGMEVKAIDDTESYTVEVVDPTGLIADSLEYTVSKTSGSANFSWDATSKTGTVTATGNTQEDMVLSLTVTPASGYKFTEAATTNRQAANITVDGAGTFAVTGTGPYTITEQAGQVSDGDTITLTLGNGFLTSPTNNQYQIEDPNVTNGDLDVTFGLTKENVTLTGPSSDFYTVYAVEGSADIMNFTAEVKKGFEWDPSAIEATDIKVVEKATTPETKTDLWAKTSAFTVTASSDGFVFAEADTSISKNGKQYAIVINPAKTTKVQSGVMTVYAHAGDTNAAAAAAPANEFTVEWVGTKLDSEISLSPDSDASKGTMTISGKTATFTLKPKKNRTTQKAIVKYSVYDTDTAASTWTTGPDTGRTALKTGTLTADDNGVYTIQDISSLNNPKSVVISVIGVEAFNPVRVTWTEDLDLYEFYKVGPTDPALALNEPNRQPLDEVEFELKLTKNAVKTERFKVYYEWVDFNGVSHDKTSGEATDIPEENGGYKFTIPKDVGSGTTVRIVIEGLKNDKDYEITFPAAQTMTDMGFGVINGTGMAYSTTNTAGTTTDNALTGAMTIRNTKADVSEVINPDESPTGLLKYEQLMMIYDADATSEIGIRFGYHTDNAVESESGIKATFAGEEIKLTRTQIGNQVTFEGTFIPKKTGELVVTGLTPYRIVTINSNTGVKLTANKATLDAAKEIVRRNADGDADQIKILDGTKFVINTEVRDGYKLGNDFAVMVTRSDDPIAAKSNIASTKTADNEWTFTVSRDTTLAYPMGNILNADGSRALTFKDEVEGAWYVDAVEWTANALGAAGIGDGLYGIGKTLTRAEAITLLYSAAGKPTVSESATFTDVATNAYYAKAVAWGLENKYVAGKNDGLYHPDDPVTRAEIVVILCAYAKGEGGTKTFPDATADWYKNQVAWAADNGVVTGYPNGNFGPGDNCTREQYAQMLYKLSGLAE